MEIPFLGTSTPAGWGEWWGDNSRATERGVVLAEERYPAYVSPTLVVEGIAAVDLDVDPCGVLYVLSASGTLHRYDGDRGTVEWVPCLTDDARYGDPTALCVTEDTIYVGYAVDSENRPRTGAPTDAVVGTASSTPDGPDTAAPTAGRVRAVSKHLLQTRWIVEEIPDGAATRRLGAPLAIAEGDGAIYVLERAHEDDGDGADTPGGYVSALDGTGAATTVVTGLTAPRDAAIDDGGYLSVLATADDPTATDDATGGPVVWRFDTADLHGPDGPISPGAGDRWIDPVDPDRAACIETAEEGELLVGVGPETNDERVLYRYRRTDEPLVAADDLELDRVAALKRSCSRLRLARGRTDGRSRGLYAIDAPGGDVYSLSETRHYRRNDRTGRYDARIVGRFDTGTVRTHWHRARIGLHLDEPSTQLRLHYRATDEREPFGTLAAISGIGTVYARRLGDAGIGDLRALLASDPEAIVAITGASPSRVRDWLGQARDRFDAWFAPTGVPPGFARPNPRDALFGARHEDDEAVGRYLWVSLELTGSESASPRVDSFRAYFPRQSYLRYLPAVYQDDAASAAFLERFLSIFESVFVDLEEEIEAITRFFDVYGIPSPFLSWLEHWLAVETDETWTEAARREFLSQAPALYRMRGTREGLLRHVGIYLGMDEYDADGHAPLSGPRPSSASPTETDAPRRTDANGTADGWTASGGSAGGSGRGLGSGDSPGRSPRTGALATERADDRSGDDERGAVGPYLLEYSALDCIDTDAVREDYRRLVSCPQCFLLLVGSSVDGHRLRAVQRIVDDERPAHTIGRVVGLRPSIRLGGHSYLGINTVLSDRTFVLERTTLGTDSVLTERELYAQVGLRSRAGEDAVLS